MLYSGCFYRLIQHVSGMVLLWWNTTRSLLPSSGGFNWIVFSIHIPILSVYSLLPSSGGFNWSFFSIHIVLPLLVLILAFLLTPLSNFMAFSCLPRKVWESTRYCPVWTTVVAVVVVQTPTGSWLVMCLVWRCYDEIAPGLCCWISVVSVELFFSIDIVSPLSFVNPSFPITTFE